MLANTRWRAGWAPARTILKKISRKDERGVTLVEYALLLALIAVVAVGSLVLLGNTVNNTLTQVSAQVISKGNANDTINVNSGTPQSAAVGAAFGAPLSVQVLNPSQDPVVGMSITFTAPEVGATGQFTTTSGTSYSDTEHTNSMGIATTTETFTANDTSGTYDVTATSPGVLSKAEFSLTNDDATDTYSVACAPATASAAVSSAYPKLTAIVTDGAKQGVNGVSVIFTAPGSGPTGTFAGGNTNGGTNNSPSVTTTVVNNVAGTADAPTFTANNVPSPSNTPYAVTANAYVQGVLKASGTCELTNNLGPASITFESGEGQSAYTGAPFASGLVAIVQDEDGNPYEGVTVTFLVADGAGTPGGTFTGGSCGGGTCTVTAVTDAQGLATADLTADGTPGNYSVTATGGTTPEGGLTSGTATFPESNLSYATADHLIIEAGNNQSALINSNFASPLEVELTDAAYNPLSGITINITAPSTGASGNFQGTSASGCLQNTCAGATVDGDFTTALFQANNVAGADYTITVTAPEAVSVAFTETNLAAATDVLTAFPGVGDQSAGAGGNAYQTNLEVSLTSGGNAVPGVGVTFSAPTSGPGGYFQGYPFSNPKVTTDSSGDATAPTLYTDGTQGDFNVTVSAPNAVSITIPEIITADNLAITEGNDQSTYTGTNFGEPLQVQYTDAAGNGINGVAITFTIVPNGAATATFATSPTCVTQTATTCVVDTASTYFGGRGYATTPALKAGSQGGTFTITATAAGGNANNVTFNETDAGYQLEIVQPTSGNETTAVDAPFPTALEVEAVNQHGVPQGSVPITFTVGTGYSGATASFSNGCTGASCTATTPTTGALEGIATASTLTANGTTGHFEVTANAPAATGPVTFDLENDTYTLVIADQSNNQIAGINNAFANPLTVQVQDQDGNGVDGVSVLFSAPSGSGTNPSGTFGGSCDNAGTCTITSTGGGYAQVPSFVANANPGLYHPTASVSGGGNPSVTFNETNTDYLLAIVSTDANNQTAGLGQPFAHNFEVSLTNNGKAVPDDAVTFTPPTTGASGTFSDQYPDFCGTPCTVNTNNGGDATAPTFTANDTAGAGYSVVVSAIGAGNTVTFTETNEAYTLVVSGGSGQSTLTGAAFAKPLAVQIELGGDPVDIAGVPITFTPPATGPSGNFSYDYPDFCGTPCTVNTNDGGIATAPTFNANATAGGPYDVVASTPGSTSLNFSLTNEAYLVAAPTGGDGSGQNIASGSKYTTISVQVTLAGQNAVNIPVTFTTPTNGTSATFGAGCNGHTCTVETNGSGIASIATTGTPTLTATGAKGTFNISVIAADNENGQSATFPISEGVSN